MKRKSRKAIASRQAAAPMVPAVQLERIEQKTSHVVGEIVLAKVNGRNVASRPNGKVVEQVKVIREAIVQRAHWDDPADQNERSKTARQVHHVRRVDPLLVLQGRGDVVTDRHIHAAERYRDDFEIASGARPGYERGETRSSSNPGGPTEAQMGALARYRAATSSVSEKQARILAAVVLRGQDVTAYARGAEISRHRAMGHLEAALDGLVDFYEPAIVGV